MDKVLQLRGRLLAASSCSYDVEILADYGNETYTFELNCIGDQEGNLSFTVNKPETISGITGKLSREEGELTFDDVALSFPMLAEGLATPISGPWHLYSALRGGYIVSVGTDGEYVRVTVRDNYQDDALTLEVWLTEENTPVQADVIWENRRILSMQIRNFQIG